MNDSKELSLSKLASIGILLCAFLGWAMAGMQLAMTSLVNGPATTQMLRKNAEAKAEGNDELTVDEDALKKSSSAWFGYVTSAFLLGAAAGGWLFGQIGDTLGRTKAMALSIMTYAVMSYLASLVHSPILFLILRAAAGLGVGGMWPNGVSLVGEVWAKVRFPITKDFVLESRPLVAGVMGTAANVGIMLQAWLARTYFDTTSASEEWRQILVYFGTSPLILGILCFLLPESPKWLAAREATKEPAADEKPAAEQPGMGEIFGSAYIRYTFVGIMLASIPLIGGWGSSNWVMKWADKVVNADASEADKTALAMIEQLDKDGDKQLTADEATGVNIAPTDKDKDGKLSQAELAESQRTVDKRLKADLLIARSLTGTISSFLGGLIATLMGRKLCYMVMSVLALGSSQLLFWFYVPTDGAFILWFGALGFFSGVFFGWLPLCLPELFPTRIRSAGAGVSFNFGRILTVATIYITAVLIATFGDNYPIIGRVTSLVYALGIVVILMAPDTSSKQQLDD